MSRAIKVSFTYSLGDDAVMLTVEATYTPGSPDTYDASRGGPGGWDPGDGPEIEIVSVKTADGKDFVIETVAVRPYRRYPEKQLPWTSLEDDLRERVVQEAAKAGEWEYAP